MPWADRQKNLDYWKERDRQKKEADPEGYRAAAAERTRRYRERNPDRVLTSDRKAKQKLKEDPVRQERLIALKKEKSDWIDAYLKDHPCVDCGELDRDVLDFDHVFGPKLYNVATLRCGPYAFQRLKDEVAKCEVRCSNCHRKVTRQRERDGTVETPNARSTRLRAERRVAAQTSCGAVPEAPTLEEKTLL